MKMREPGVPTVDEFLEMNLAKGSCLACERKSHQRVTGKSIQKNDGRTKKDGSIAGRLIRRHLE